MHRTACIAGVVAALTLVPAKKEIVQAGGETQVSYFAAFQNGVFRVAAFDAVVRHFTG